jgi:hypothetical protein
MRKEEREGDRSRRCRDGPEEGRSCVDQTTELKGIFNMGNVCVIEYFVVRVVANYRVEFIDRRAEGGLLKNNGRKRAVDKRRAARELEEKGK